MNEVDSDNNIVGNVPFYDMSIPSKKSTLVQKVAFVLKCLLALVIIGGLIAGIVYVYRKFGHKIPKVTKPAVVNRASS